uniref:non-specific serine/threonine protein kinase n=1 Tax=Oryza nivara TaxID=4536 RepID=A0A0E0IXT7_ORYNI
MMSSRLATFALLVIITLSSSSRPCPRRVDAAREWLARGASIAVEDHATDVLRSPDGTFAAGFYDASPTVFTFSVWFARAADRAVVWTAARARPVHSKGARVTLDARHGALVLTDYGGEVVWNSSTPAAGGSGGARVRLHDSGNLVVEDAGGKTLWQSFDFPTDTLLPTQRLTAATRLVSRDRLLSAGYYSLGFSDYAMLSLFYDNGNFSSIYWPNPYFSYWQNNRKIYNFSREAAMDALGQFLSSDGTTFEAADLGAAGVRRRLTLDTDGNLRAYSLDGATGAWSVSWMAFGNPCNIHGVCGPNAVCLYSPAPVCVCAPGHERVDASDWSRGCRPTFRIECGRPAKLVALPHSDFWGYDLNDGEVMPLGDCANKVVAVKVLKNVSRQSEEEFQAELSVIGRIYHMNLVRMWGCCSQAKHRILVSEYIENGSLAQRLFDHGFDDDVLDWNQRFKIALGVAKGLAYLHSECSEWIVHCDMKPENILLDKDLEPKITDFGLSKLLNRDGSHAILTRIRGTRGYMAPEWVTNLPVTEKVDVYSYGGILLELVKGIRISEWVIHGIKVCEMDIRMVVRATRQMMGSNEERSIEDLVDYRLNGDFNHVQVKLMLEIAVSCLEEDRSKRPNMNSVVQALISVEAYTFTDTYVFDVDTRIRSSVNVNTCVHSEKPENILLDKDLEPKITDFELSKLLNRDGSYAILTWIRGTRGYMAPNYGVILLPLVKVIRISEWVIYAIKNYEMDTRMVVRAACEKLEPNERRSIEDLVDHRLNGDSSRWIPSPSPGNNLTRLRKQGNTNRENFIISLQLVNGLEKKRWLKRQGRKTLL